VDTILHVVKQRESVTKFLRSTEMRDFANAIHGSAGLSANFEFVTQMVKLGGNGRRSWQMRWCGWASTSPTWATWVRRTFIRVFNDFASRRKGDFDCRAGLH
jgi:hypothetical protein